MGGQACVFYGAAEFSRDLDILVLADPGNLALLRSAMETLAAEVIAVPPFAADYLERGHAVHFRCRREDVANLRIDIMSKLRGVEDFERLWLRRTVIEVAGVHLDLISAPDLVLAKKTQRDKDWVMIRRLLEQVYFTLPAHPNEETVSFLLRELRTPELLRALVRDYPEQAVLASRRAVQLALSGSEDEVRAAFAEEEALERENDRAYWAPLKQELEHLRRSRRTAL
jgi:hypothetical protein